MGSGLNDILASVKTEIEVSAHLIITISGLAEKYGINRKALLYEYTAVYGISPLDYHSKLKYELFRELIKEKNGGLPRTSYDIARSLGFKSDSGLHYFLIKMSGMTFREHLRNTVLAEESPVKELVSHL